MATASSNDLARNHRHHRPEDLFLRDPHRSARRRRRSSARGRSRFACAPVVSAWPPQASVAPSCWPISTYFITVSSWPSADRRPHLRRRIEAVADAQRLGARDEPLDETPGRPSRARRRGWPRCSAGRLVPNPPHRQPSTASSRLASSMIMMTFLPPISRWTFLNVGAACRETVRPTSVEPVNETTRTASLTSSAVPTSLAAAGDHVDDARAGCRPPRGS